MNKTTFAGLTQLEPNENPQTDGASFFGRDRATIDRYLEIGAVTHRHDEHAALGNPDRAPSATVTSTGGTIPAGLTAYLGYTLLDADDGETTISPVVAVSTPPPLDPPQSAPVASADYSAGDLLANTYYYVLTLIDAFGGETPAGPWAQVDRAPGFASGQIHLSGLQAPVVAASAAGWRIYRATGGGVFELMATGSGDTYTDTGAGCLDCSQRPPAPTENTTNRHNTLHVTVPSGALMSEASGFRLYASDDGTFSTPALLGTFPTSSAMMSLDYAALNVLNGSPPDRSTSVRGASQIDPDTDLLDWHWKRPVATSAALGSGSAGDVRVVLDQDWPWTVPGAAAAVAADWEPMMPLREVTFFATSAALASAAVYMGSAGMRRDWQLLAVQTNKPARVRLYATSSKQGADKTRSLDADPSGNHGVLLDLVTEAGQLLWLLSPQVHGSSLETVPTKMIPISVTNLDSSGVVEVSLTYLPG